MHNISHELPGGMPPFIYENSFWFLFISDMVEKNITKKKNAIKAKQNENPIGNVSVRNRRR